MTSTATFDLQSISESKQDTAWLTIDHPVTKAPTAMRIQVASPDSETFRRVDRRIKNRNMQAARKNKNAMTVEALESSGLELLTAVTLGWENVSMGGEPLAFSAENVRKLYADFPFIREQVDEFVGERTNFFSS